MVSAPRTGTSRSTRYRVATAWGDARIDVIGEDVVGLRPPMGDAAHGDLPDAHAGDAPAVVRELASRLAAYLDGDEVELASRAQVEQWLGAAGVTGFRRDLSLALFDVPRGVTLAYGELAALAGRPGAARAAGTTCARNPLPIVIPCHRVVHAGARHGDVGSYGAATGSDYKRRLLELEHAAIVRPR
jgi:methylated-DNA-[protein]-cysteine S-methyltransferase